MSVCRVTRCVPGPTEFALTFAETSTRSFSDESSSPLPASASSLASGSSDPAPPPQSLSTPPHRPGFDAYRGASTLTPDGAQQYLTDLLHLPPSQQIPPKLALQILTHKSYRFVSLPRNPYLQPAPLPEEEDNNWAASHNARLSFLGRRAMSTYLAMFVHAAVATSGVPLHQLDFLRGRSLETKLANLSHVTNVGREIGAAWGVQDVVRWDHNPVSRSTRPRPGRRLMGRSTPDSRFMEWRSKPCWAECSRSLDRPPRTVLSTCMRCRISPDSCAIRYSSRRWRRCGGIWRAIWEEAFWSSRAAFGASDRRRSD